MLHDVSHGGLAMAIAEICIKSGVGAKISADPTELLEESPHRFVAVVPVAFDWGADEYPKRLVGTIGGHEVDFGSRGSIDVELASQIWRDALPRRLG